MKEEDGPPHDAKGEREDEGPVHDDDDGSSASPSEAEDTAEPVESLVAGRAKRATAGNRLSTLIDREADDDELELLFAEDEEDIEFEATDPEDASDVQIESSSDEDDGQAPANGDDELEGERELQKQARAERQAQKRKTQDAFMRPPGLRKKVKVDPTASVASTAPASRPRKRSERVSWIPTVEEGPTRSSSRRQTVQNKEVIHARMKETEKRRLHQIAVMEAAAKRKEQSKPKVMTQADRLAEAERTERKNSKSLNRWEETEKKRQEEQQARLDALHNRRLEGPVITSWSGLAVWVNGRLAKVGGRQVLDDGNGKAGKGQKGRKGADTAASSKKNLAADTDEGAITVDSALVGSTPVTVPPLPPPPPAPVQPSLPPSINQSDVSPQQFVFTTPQGPSTFLQGIHHYAAMAPDAHQRAASPPMVQPPPDLVEYSARNVIILEGFDQASVKNPEEQRRILFKRRMGKVQKPVHDLCAITSLPAKFRDPVTGLAYLNSFAYKEIQRLRAGFYTWSDLVGCYVGPAGAAARGVPEKFHQTKHGGRAEGGKEEEAETAAAAAAVTPSAS